MHLSEGIVCWAANTRYYIHFYVHIYIYIVKLFHGPLITNHEPVRAIFIFP